MGNRSKQTKWPGKIRRRADRDHAAKWLAKQQKKHLLKIKSETALRQMRLASRVRQK